MDSPWWLPPVLRAGPEADPALYAACSTLTHASGCRTPLLFIVGEADLRCPRTEAERYYRALKRDARDTEMVRLPGSDHLGSWIGPFAARAGQNDALVEWFTRHLLEDGGRPGAESR